MLDSKTHDAVKDDLEALSRGPSQDSPINRCEPPGHERSTPTKTTLAHSDLLPIQQLARLDDDMLQSTTNALPTRLAARLWKARTDQSIGDNPWETGCKEIKASVKASDLKHWIRRQEPGTSETYAKKLVSRTIDAMLDLSKHRLAVRKRTKRKNGLEYTDYQLTGRAHVEEQSR
ncbi:hypothetical protein C489_18866 [Natrinema versiforme JCM 10478]|uniref:Uncharacterized protein n=1 Tax=Natrinema versiforme JCM 10478 TaxID=1227496 RepID=L9XQ21_9EURY|nr:hypothetical protein C489_18866 [Natrinema versiforme JCM 10478]